MSLVPVDPDSFSLADGDALLRSMAGGWDGAVYRAALAGRTRCRLARITITPVPGEDRLWRLTRPGHPDLILAATDQPDECNPGRRRVVVCWPAPRGSCVGSSRAGDAPTP